VVAENMQKNYRNSVVSEICRNSVVAEKLQKYCGCRKFTEILWLKKYYRDSAVAENLQKN
jgi:hypothetical protein